jgi:hypothetical protein
VAFGRPWDDPSGMVLPVATLVLAVTPYVSRIVRATLLEVLDSDYVELARLKGIPEQVVEPSQRVAHLHAELVLRKRATVEPVLRRSRSPRPDRCGDPVLPESAV